MSTTNLSMWGKLQAAPNIAALTTLVAEISVGMRHPVPTTCWFETAHEFIETDVEYSDLLLKAAARFDHLVETH